MNSDRALKRRREEAFPDDVEVEQGNGTVSLALPSVKGVLYEGEPLKLCPLCEEPLMWYFLKKNQEIQACSSSKCVYPFDDSAPYCVRSREERDINPDQLALQGGSSSNEGAGASPKPDEGMSLVPYNQGRRDSVREFTKQQLVAFLNTPKELRRPTRQPRRYHDTDASKLVKEAFDSLDQEEVD